MMRNPVLASLILALYTPLSLSHWYAILFPDDFDSNIDGQQFTINDPIDRTILNKLLYGTIKDSFVINNYKHSCVNIYWIKDIEINKQLYFG